MATFDRPAYVVSMKRTEKVLTAVGDLYSVESIPIEDIETIYEIRPVSTDGNISVDIGRSDTPYFGITYSLQNYMDMHCPEVVYAFKEVSIDEVRKTLKPDIVPEEVKQAA